MDEQIPPEVTEPAAQSEPVAAEATVVAPAALPQEEVAPVVSASPLIPAETTAAPVTTPEHTDRDALAPEIPKEASPAPRPEHTGAPLMPIETPAQTLPPLNTADVAVPVPSPRYSPEDRAKAHAAKQEKKEAMLAAILTLALELHEQGLSITNDAVQAGTGLSDTTVAVYLRELVVRGYLVKHGKGRGVRYVLQ